MFVYVGNPLQCSCLENLRDGGAWWASVYGVAQSQTQLKQLSSSSSMLRKRGMWGSKGINLNKERRASPRQVMVVFH